MRNRKANKEEQSIVPVRLRRTVAALWRGLRNPRVWVLLMLVAVLCGVFTWFTALPRRQRRAVETVRKARGFVAYDDEFMARSTAVKGRSAKPQPATARVRNWARRGLGDALTRDLTLISLDGQKLTADDLVALRGLTRLQRLYLNGTNIDDSLLENLSDLPALEQLELRETRIQGPGLRYLGNLTELRELYLSDTPVRDAGLEVVRRMRKLEELHLSNTAITNDTLPHVSGLTNLHYLGLRGTSINDDGLAHLKGLVHLQTLDLQGTAISDDGLEFLSGLKDLRILYLDETRVTAAGVDRLRNALPLVQIYGAPKVHGPRSIDRRVPDRPTSPCAADAPRSRPQILLTAR
jgi:hypothetical protein